MGNSNLSKNLLSGIKVVELGQNISIPLVGMLLAEQGAQVVSIVNTSSSINDPILNALLSRGKIEVPLNLETPQDRSKLAELLEYADIVLENYHYGFLKKIGIDFDEIRKDKNPGLISCRISSFPNDDPRNKMPDYEAIPSMAGFLYTRPIGKPKYYDFPVGSIMAGLYGANGVIAALIARHKIGKGQHINTSLYECNLFSQVIQLLIKTGIPKGFLPMKMVGTPFMSPWLCKDNRYIYLHITLPTHNAKILDMLEINGYSEEVKNLRTILSPETMNDPSQVKSIKEAKKIRKAYEKIFITKRADEWEELLGRELCCIKVRNIEEWINEVLNSKMTDVCLIEDSQFGEMIGVGPAITSKDYPPILTGRILEMNAFEKILSTWKSKPGYFNNNKIEEGIELLHPLQGIRVLDLSRVIAGPCCSRVLAELGAEVITIQNPTNLDWALSFHLVFNAGKKSVTLDFTTEEGKRKLWKIMEKFQPDVFIQNYRHLNIAKEIGVDPETVSSHFPKIVYTHLNAYGNEGGWMDRPGFEQVVQAVSGIQISYGENGKPKLLPTPIIDIATGLSGAFATLLGIYHKETTGEGLFTSTHLTTHAVYFQINKIANYQREKCLEFAKKKNVKIDYQPENEIISGILRAMDNYICLSGPKKDILKWMKKVDLIDDSSKITTREDIFRIASKQFWLRPLSYWKQSIIDAGFKDIIGIISYPDISKIVDEIKYFDSSKIPIVRKRIFEGCPSELTFVGNPLKMSLTPIVDVSPPPPRGANTREILAQIGEVLPEGAGTIPYPSPKPFIIWLFDFVRWAYFIWRSGNI